MNKKKKSDEGFPSRSLKEILWSLMLVVFSTLCV